MLMQLVHLELTGVLPYAEYMYMYTDFGGCWFAPSGSQGSIGDQVQCVSPFLWLAPSGSPGHSCRFRGVLEIKSSVSCSSAAAASVWV